MLGSWRVRRVALMVAAGCLLGVCAGCTDLQPVSYRSYGGTAIVSPDGRTITVGGYQWRVCPATVTPVAVEDTTRVALFLKYVIPPNPPACSRQPDDAGMAPVPAYNIRLRKPLGNRKLLDGATGRASGWISSRLVLRLTRAGYQLARIEPEGCAPDATGCQAGATEYYYVQLHGASGLTIVQSAGSVKLPGPGHGGWIPGRVRGHPGRATRNLITWRANGLTDYIQVDVTLDAASPDPQVLTTRQLIAIADDASTYSLKPIPVVFPAPP